METYAGLSQLCEEGQAGSPARRAAGVRLPMSLHLGVVERQWARGYFAGDCRGWGGLIRDLKRLFVLVESSRAASAGLALT